MTEPIKILDIVALKEDIPAEHLACGQVGTVVEFLAPGVYEVEFSDNRTGQTFAEIAVRADQLLALRYAPV